MGSPVTGAFWHPGGAVAPALTSQKMSVSWGGGVKSLRLDVHWSPPWQLAQPATLNRILPTNMSLNDVPPLSSKLFNGAFGVRIASFTHSFSAESAFTGTELPGKVTVISLRFSLGFTKATMTQGASCAS